MNEIKLSISWAMGHNLKTPVELDFKSDNLSVVQSLLRGMLDFPSILNIVSNSSKKLKERHCFVLCLNEDDVFQFPQLTEELKNSKVVARDRFVDEYLPKLVATHTSASQSSSRNSVITSTDIHGIRSSSDSGSIHESAKLETSFANIDLTNNHKECNVNELEKPVSIGNIDSSDCGTISSDSQDGIDSSSSLQTMNDANTAALLIRFGLGDIQNVNADDLVFLRDNESGSKGSYFHISPPALAISLAYSDNKTVATICKEWIERNVKDFTMSSIIKAASVAKAEQLKYVYRLAHPTNFVGDCSICGDVESHKSLYCVRYSTLSARLSKFRSKCSGCGEDSCLKEFTDHHDPMSTVHCVELAHMWISCVATMKAGTLYLILLTMSVTSVMRLWDGPPSNMQILSRNFNSECETVDMVVLSDMICC